jgi:esterase/lipase superfamily enzyme
MGHLNSFLSREAAKAQRRSRYGRPVIFNPTEAGAFFLFYFLCAFAALRDKNYESALRFFVRTKGIARTEIQRRS